MQDERLKLILTLLGGVIFAMFFILIALVVPVKKSTTFEPTQKATSKLGQISQEAKNR
jgi:hypothetical protein